MEKKIKSSTERNKGKTQNSEKAPKMKALIRIRGRVDVPQDIKETLNRLRLKRKFGCVVVKSTPEIAGMIKKVRNYVAYGDIDKETFTELIKKRGKAVDKSKKVEVEKAVSSFFEKNEKKLQELNIKPFFRLHPPIKGIKTKKHFPKGALGNHKEKINNLIKRML